MGTIGQPRALDALEYGLAVETRGFNLFVSGLPGSGRLTTVLDYLARARGREAGALGLDLRQRLRQSRPAERDLDCPRAAAPSSRARWTSSSRPPGARSPRVRERGVRAPAARDRRGDRASERESEEEELTRVRGRARHRPEDDARRRRLGAARRREAHHARALRAATRGAAGGDHEGHERGRGASGRLHPPGSPAREGGGRARAGARARGRALRDGAALPRARGALRGAPGGSRLPRGRRRGTCWRASATSATGEESAARPRARGSSDGTSPATASTSSSTTAAAEGAPIVVERNPTYYNLLGRIEYRASFGAMVTDFREIKPGALHRANGGFLVLDVARRAPAPVRLGRAQARAAKRVRCGSRASARSSAPSRSPRSARSRSRST